MDANVAPRSDSSGSPTQLSPESTTPNPALMEERMKLEELPVLWQREIKALRKENGRLRIRSRELRLQLSELTQAGPDGE